MKHRLSFLAAGLCLALGATHASAQTRVTYKSAKTGSSYYQMGVEIAEAVKTASEGKIIVTIEESQGSVQNVAESATRGGNYVFTTPPALVGNAQAASGPFKDKANPKFNNIRALFPIPSLTMHFVVREDSGVKAFSDLAGKNLLIGKGSFGASEGAKYLELFGLKDKVSLSNAELNNAVAALKNKQIDGFVTAGSYPAPNVIEAAAGSSVTLLSLSEEQIKATSRTRLVIPAGTYSGQKTDVVTTSLPVVAYATTDMSDDTAYALTKAFWSQRDRMAASAPWWKGVNGDMLANIEGKIHPGALRYYTEAKMAVGDQQR
ncbi:TRAP ABC transporter substrate-binding protein [Hydrogenophaga crassostreae]|uniref:TRAP ABC transporter substrate-binding protein n=1 Tax=Hydrogenophaga crassostreae TaxID=1763535 RepID=A0A167IE84_9BURK|nr:TAXI family TRAP transporter solute-binding subunit [Hydrogenophaga crassostreae]AOW13246.1 TRAP ABC transporter substrate-binding protein [Hydrogenophaga crassostreae]OAD42607.1 TRAP ABC transporter substrate-binding protein [Hydrogenophaga crassostreae]